MICGLLGRMLIHSYSPALHKMLGSYEYRLWEKEPEEAEKWIREGDWYGMNVTIPYKRTAAALCDELSPHAAQLGSVNTLLKRADGSVFGDNTDYEGFRYLLKSSGLDVSGRKALVLGSGGASVTVQAVLQDAGAEPIVISRSGTDNYSNLEKHADAALIVNTTPVGMFPQVGETPIPLDGFAKLEGVFDLIYNPARTCLMLEAEKRGIPAFGGLGMLAAQAILSSRIWGLTGRSVYDAGHVAEELSRSMQNIVLIGMPGCGKSDTARMLGRLLGRPVLDSDDEIVRESGMRIPEIFSRFGEDDFRRRETAVLKRFGASYGTVIATGGGAVTREENYLPLHQNGVIVWIRRDPDKLEVRGRPIFLTKDVRSLYEERKDAYERFADFAVDSRPEPLETAKSILEVLKL